MNSKGFTLIEIIVVIMMAVIVLSVVTCSIISINSISKHGLKGTIERVWEGESNAE